MGMGVPDTHCMKELATLVQQEPQYLLSSHRISIREPYFIQNTPFPTRKCILAQHAIYPDPNPSSPYFKAVFNFLSKISALEYFGNVNVPKQVEHWLPHVQILREISEENTTLGSRKVPYEIDEAERGPCCEMFSIWRKTG